MVAGDGETLVTGDAVNVAARLEQASGPGEVLIGAETRRLVRDAVRVEPISVDAKGKGAVDAFRLVEVDLEAAPVARRFETPLVGRGSELEHLTQAFDRSVREQRCHLFTLLGAAGVGKSRLVAQFLAGADAAILEGRCLDYGEGITFWPVVSVLKRLGPRADETLAQLVDGVSMPNELFFAVRTLLEEVAAETPIVVVFEDIQWGEETFLELVDHIADLSRGAPILLLCIARPELLDRRPGWGGGKLNTTTILLEPLSPEECAELIGVHGGVEDELRDRILASAAGNPLFVEEMLALAREDGGDVRVPATVQALLQARIDQLAAPERTVIERGAVEGEIFHRGPVLELAPTTDVDAQLMGLVRKELVHPTPPTIAGERAFRFRHLLLRDAAYGAMPKELRAELHERFADWLTTNAGALVEVDELTGYHLEQSARYREELGRHDDVLAARAGERLWSAGRHAAARSDLPAALGLLGRAAALLPAADPRHEEALLDRLVLLLNLETSPVLRDERTLALDSLAGSSSDRLRRHGRVARLRVAAWDPSVPHAEIEREADAIAAEFEGTGDERGLAAVWGLRGILAWGASRAADTLAAADRAAAHARHGGVVEYPIADLVIRYGPLINGPFTIAEISERAAALPPSVHMRFVLRARVALAEGRYEEALSLTDQGVERLEALGLPVDFVPPMDFRALVLHEQGRFDEALELWRQIHALHRERGDLGFLSTALVHAAETLLALGEVDEAERLALEGEEFGGPDDLINFAYGRRVRALVALERGELTEAQKLARSAVDYGLRTDLPLYRGTAHLTLGRVLRAAGELDEARAEYMRALTLWENLGWTAWAKRDRRLLEEL